MRCKANESRRYRLSDPILSTRASQHVWHLCARKNETSLCVHECDVLNVVHPPNGMNVRAVVQDFHRLSSGFIDQTKLVNQVSLSHFIAGAILLLGFSLCVQKLKMNAFIFIVLRLNESRIHSLCSHGQPVCDRIVSHAVEFCPFRPIRSMQLIFARFATLSINFVCIVLRATWNLSSVHFPPPNNVEY